MNKFVKDAVLQHLGFPTNSFEKLPECGNGGRKTLLKASQQGECLHADILAQDQNGKNHILGPVILSEKGAVALGDGSLESGGTECTTGHSIGEPTHLIKVTGEDKFGSVIFSDLKPI